MRGSQLFVAGMALALVSTPGWAQQPGHAHAQAAAGPAQEMSATAMICSMGMLPHPGMSMGGMMGGQGMGGMMPGGMAGMKRDSAMAGGMQHGAMMGGMQHDMGAMEHPVTPTMLIHHAQELGLTADQQAKVTQLAKTSQATCEEHLKAAAASHHEAVAALAKPTPDVSSYEGELKEALEHLVEGHVAVVKAGIEASALLTPEQRDKLKATAAAMHGKQ